MTCLCNVATLTPADVRCLIFTDCETWWVVFNVCAIHGTEDMSPVWSPRTGWLTQETALIATECRSKEDEV